MNKKFILIFNILVIFFINQYSIAYMHEFEFEKLHFEIEKNKSFLFNLNYNNNNLPQLGSHQGELCLGLANITELSDLLIAEYVHSEGMDIYSGKFFIRIPAIETKLSFGYEKSESSIETYPYDSLEIESDADIYYISISQPVYQTDSENLAFQFKYESMKLNTYMLGMNMSFTPGVIDGQLEHSILRVAQLWNKKSKSSKLTIKSTFSFGLDSYKTPKYIQQQSDIDGKFFAWLGEVSSEKKLLLLDSSMIFRADLQVSDEPLPDNYVNPSEHFSIGGLNSVRGYRKNLLTTDNGITASIEWRIPLFKINFYSNKVNDGVVQIASFFDCGHGWNVKNNNPEIDSVYSLGLGLLWNISKTNFIKIYWGEALRSIERITEYDLQDDGLSFFVNIGGAF